MLQSLQKIDRLDPEKFQDPDKTAKGENRASVALKRLDTLWINTGTLCNIECVNCYIESSPTNDRLAYFGLNDAIALYDEIKALELGTREIGFTGGEPFLNKDMVPMAKAALERGFDVMILTNAMQPMMRPKVQAGLLDLQSSYSDKLTLRISIDHHSEELHDTERGEGSFEKTLQGMDWLNQHGFTMHVAGRTCWNESEAEARKGYADLFARRGYGIDPTNSGELVLFPEMDETVDVPEITEACWGILGLSPADVMCATSRMVVKRKGDNTPTVLPCTLLPYDASFGMGSTLKASMEADGGNFDNGSIKLNHPHCAKFCVLGGGSCSAA